MIISYQISIAERANILHYFPHANAIDSEVYKTSREAIKKIFGPHAPLAEFLFLQYQVKERRLAEVAGR